MFSSVDKSTALFWMTTGEWALLISSVIVVIGIFGEIRKSSHEWLSWLHLFEFMVLLGVAGEVISDGIIFAASHRLQSIQEAELSDANTKAASAVAAAATLGVSFGNLDQYVKDKSKEFKTAADELKLATKDLNNVRDEALSAAQGVKKDAADMRLALNEIQQLREKIHDLTTDRIISVPRVSEKLKSFSKTPFILGVNDDHEHAALAIQIANALENAGWEWKPKPSSKNGIEIGLTFPGKPIALLHNGLGISIEIAKSDLKYLKQPAEVLAESLKQENLKNIGMRIISDTDMEKENKTSKAIYVLIGAKQ